MYDLLDTRSKGDTTTSRSENNPITDQDPLEPIKNQQQSNASYLVPQTT